MASARKAPRAKPRSDAPAKRAVRDRLADRGMKVVAPRERITGEPADRSGEGAGQFAKQVYASGSLVSPLGSPVRPRSLIVDPRPQDEEKPNRATQQTIAHQRLGPRVR